MKQNLLRPAPLRLAMSLAIAAAVMLSSALVMAKEEKSRKDTSEKQNIQIQIPNQFQALGKYHLGVVCFPVAGALRAQLKLDEGQGLLVDRVMPKSPAKTAGIKRYDILLKADGKRLGKVKDLVEAVNKKKDNPLKLELLRAGKKKTLTATPAKSPIARPQIVQGVVPKQFQKWFEGKGFNPLGKGPLRFNFIHPGIILPGGQRLPNNLSISISKSGDGPAKIVVKRGDETWELTEKELDKLPDDIRPHVQRMLGGGGIFGPGGKFNFRLNQDFKLPDFRNLRPGQKLPQFRFSPDANLDQQFKELREELEQMRKSIEQIPKRKKGGDKDA